MDDAADDDESEAVDDTYVGAVDNNYALTDDAARLARDEDAARLARDHYREAGLPVIEPDPEVAPYLARGESVVGVRPDTALARIDGASEAATREVGRLYVTDRRLLHLAAEVTSVPLADILELAIAEERILVTLEGSRGLVLDVADPRQFRVLIAAAMSASRG